MTQSQWEVLIDGAEEIHGELYDAQGGRQAFITLQSGDLANTLKINGIPHSLEDFVVVGGSLQNVNAQWSIELTSKLSNI